MTRPSEPQALQAEAEPAATLTLEACTPIVGQTAPFGAFAPMGVGLPIEDLRSFLSRPILVTSLPFSLTQSVISSIAPLNLFLSNSVIANKLQYYRNLRATVCARVEMPVNPHFYGENYVVMYKPTLSTATGQYFAERYYQMRPGAIFDANTGAPVVLRYPFFHFKNRLAMQDSTQTTNYVALSVVGLSPLGRDDAVAVGTPSFNVYVWLEDVELLDATPYTTAAGADSGAGPSHQEPTPGPISGFLHKVGRAASLAVPVFPALAPASIIAKGLGDLAVMFGFSKPLMRQAIGWVRTRSFGSAMSLGVGLDDVSSLTINPDSAHPLHVGCGGEVEDVLAFNFWTRRWSWLGGFSYSTTSSPGTLLASIPVTPLIYSYGNGVPATVSIPAIASSAWVGSLEYRLTVAGTPYHKGKLLVAYVPSLLTVSQPTIATLMNTTHACIFDVGAHTDIVVRAGWSQDSNCAVVAVTGTGNTSQANLPLYPGTFQSMSPGAMTAASSLVGTNGQIIIVVFDSLSTTAAGSLTVNMWVRGGPDLQFAGASTFSAGYVVAAGPAAPLVGETGVLDDMLPICHFGGSLVGPGQGSRICGEEIVSFRPLLKRFVPMFLLNPTTTPSSGASTDYTALTWPVQQYPPVVRTTQGQPYSTYSTNGGAIYCTQTLMGLLSSCFVGMSGGTRLRMTAIAQSSPMVVSYFNLADVHDPDKETASTPAVMTFNYAQATAVATAASLVGTEMRRRQAGYDCNAATSGGVAVSVEVPHRSKNSFVPPIDGSSSSILPYGGAYVAYGTGSPANSIYSADVAAAEDFNYVGFLGVPVLQPPPSWLTNGSASWVATT